jgi:hypothetical protein
MGYRAVIFTMALLTWPSITRIMDGGMNLLMEEDADRPLGIPNGGWNEKHDNRIKSFQSNNLANATLLVHGAAPTNSVHWLETRIQLGKYLGSGVASVAFEAKLAVDDPLISSPSKQYIIKFTGDHHRNGKVEPRFGEFGAIAVELTARLAPHPSIPQTIYFAKSTPNPFRTGTFFLPANKLDSSLGKRLLQATNMSIAVTERAIQTHEHVDEDGVLSIPKSKVPCFWRRLFEILDYVHSRNIRFIDTKFWNMLLQDGEIILFDWHMGDIVVTSNDTPISSKQGKKQKLPFRHVILEEDDTVHSYDVYKVGKRVREYLDSIPKKKRDADWRRLGDMRKRMQGDDPPSFGWLVKNHEYFVHQSNNTTSCSLVW